MGYVSFHHHLNNIIISPAFAGLILKLFFEIFNKHRLAKNKSWGLPSSYNYHILCLRLLATIYIPLVINPNATTSPA